MTEYFGLIKALQKGARDHAERERWLQQTADQAERDNLFTPEQRGQFLCQLRLRLKQQEQSERVRARKEEAKHGFLATLGMVFAAVVTLGLAWELLLWLMLNVFLPLLGSALGFRH